MFSRKDAFTQHMKELVAQARSRGLKSDWFRTPKLVATCLWPTRVSEALVRRAAGYDAVGVVGCESAVTTVRRALPDLPVVQLVRVTGIANYRLQAKLPATVRILESAHVPLLPPLQVLRPEPPGCKRVVAPTTATPPKDGDAKPRVLASP